MPKAVTAVSVADFFTKYGAKLKAELIAGSEGVHRQIREPSINRPALALTGFYKYFAYKRVQVVGSTEMTYFKTLTPMRQAEMMHAMIDRGIPCLSSRAISFRPSRCSPSRASGSCPSIAPR